jgi:hypothetical protein
MKIFPFYEEQNEIWSKINLNYNLHTDENFLDLNTGSASFKELKIILN